MKHLVTLIFLLLAAPLVKAQTVAPAPAPAAADETELVASGPRPLSAKEADKRARKARRQNGPEIYKGTLAQKRRLIIDAPEAEKEVEPNDDVDGRPGKSMSAKNEETAAPRSKR